VLGRNCHMPTGWILRYLVRPQGRCCRGTCCLSQREKYATVVVSTSLPPSQSKPINTSAWQLFASLERKISSTSGDEREGAFLFKRVSVLVQCYNAVLLHVTLPAVDCTDLYPLLLSQFLNSLKKISAECEKWKEKIIIMSFITSWIRTAADQHNK